MFCAGNAQILEEGEAALVYYSPKTAIQLDFTYLTETQERGIYAAYAEDMLGAEEYVKETTTTCTIKDVHIGSATTTDYSRPHKVSAESGIPMLLHINEKGLLTGYNTTPEEKKQTSKSFDNSTKPAEKSRMSSTCIAPYSEEVLKAGTVEAQAFEVAKQIFHLRETRSYLLNGEVEHAPADGKAMELVLAELDKQEQALTELFVGKKSKYKAHKIVRIEPSDEGHLLFFSHENGFTESDNIDADTIFVHMTCQQQTAKPVEDKKKKVLEASPIVYNLPGQCTVDVQYKGHSLANRVLPVAQLGLDVALPKNWFVGRELPQIKFSEKTGNIISISK